MAAGVVRGMGTSAERVYAGKRVFESKIFVANKFE